VVGGGVASFRRHLLHPIPSPPVQRQRSLFLAVYVLEANQLWPDRGQSFPDHQE